MTLPISDYREETATTGAAAAPVRYPLSPRRYLLAALRQKTLPPRERGKSSFALSRPRRMKQSARGLLLWVPLWYLIAQLLLFVWMDESWQLNRTRVEHDKWEQLHRHMAQAPDRPLVLVMGSSRTDWAFQAGQLSGQPGPDGRPLLVYNFGVPTTGPLHEALYLNDLLDEGVRPRLILLELVTTHLNESRRGILSEEHFTEAHWLTAHQLAFFRRYLSNPRRATLQWLEASVAPWYGYRWTIHQRLLGKPESEVPVDQALQPMDAWGWRLLAEDPGTPEYRAWRWAAAGRMYAESLRRFHLGAKPAQAMHEMLSRCRREHVPVALVMMPVTREFNELYNAEGRAELATFIEELRHRYGVPLVDATDWLEREDFDDGHHVLTAGAYKFTRRMSEEVQKLLAQTQSPGEDSSTP